MTASTRQAYAVAEAVTRTQARNFYYGIRLLPPDRRVALCAVYALARRIDDVGDGDLDVADKVAGLDAVRADLGAVGRGEVGSDPVLVALADAVARFPIPLDALGEVVDGVAMDVAGRTYPTFEALEEYCRCVAGAVGRLCLGVFAARPDPAGPGHADALGIALQQTNILRDIREDLLNGRVYLPTEDLDRFGVDLALDEDGALVDAEGALSALIRHGAQRARGWYARGLELVPLLDRRSAACCTAMSGIYQRLTTVIEQDPTAVLHQRLSLSGWQKAGVAVASLAGRPGVGTGNAR